MKKIWVSFTAFILITSCGQRPTPRTSVGPTNPVVISDQNPITNTETNPQKNPGTAKLPLRTQANQSEIAIARQAYLADCAYCHSPLERSTKKSVTMARLTQASVPAAIPLHTELLNLKKWPVDTVDIIDDGIDTAVLNASAMVQVLQ